MLRGEGKRGRVRRVMVKERRIPDLYFRLWTLALSERIQTSHGGCRIDCPAGGFALTLDLPARLSPKSRRRRLPCTGSTLIGVRASRPSSPKATTATVKDMSNESAAQQARQKALELSQKRKEIDAEIVSRRQDGHSIQSGSPGSPPRASSMTRRASIQTRSSRRV